MRKIPFFGLLNKQRRWFMDEKLPQGVIPFLADQRGKEG
jgi:hypothetical protein